MSAKAMPATVYVAVRRHLSEVKLCARARAAVIAPGELCKVRMRMAELEADGGRRTVKKQI